MKYYIDFIKVNWHCLLKTFANIRGEDHRVVTHHYISSWKRFDRYMVYCTCGYNKEE